MNKRGTDESFRPANLHECPVEFDRSAAEFINRQAARASDNSVLEGEHVSLEEQDRRYLMFALPGFTREKRNFLDLVRRLDVRIDDDRTIHLADWPRFHSYSLDRRAEIVRGTPVIVPMAEVGGESFTGDAHDAELFVDGESTGLRKRWLVPDERSGPIAESVRGGPGPGEVTFRFRETDFSSMSIVFYTDARFGDPVYVQQITGRGRRTPLSYRQVGVDMVGDRELWLEGYVEGFQPGLTDRFDIRMKFTRSGEGYFAAVGQMLTRAEANRTIDVP